METNQPCQDSSSTRNVLMEHSKQRLPVQHSHLGDSVRSSASREVLVLWSHLGWLGSTGKRWEHPQLSHGFYTTPGLQLKAEGGVNGTRF